MDAVLAGVYDVLLGGEKIEFFGMNCALNMPLRWSLLVRGWTFSINMPSLAGLRGSEGAEERVCERWGVGEKVEKPESQKAEDGGASWRARG